MPDPPSPPAKPPVKHVSHRLRSDEVITVPEDFEIGYRVSLHREHNSALLAMQVEAHEYDNTTVQNRVKKYRKRC
jgi:hypothetical protein